MIKGIILDMDGLISDTEKLHMKAFIKAFDDYNIPLNEEEYRAYWIRDGLGTDDVLELKGSDMDARVVRDRKKEYFDILLEEELKPMPYALEFIKHFYGRVPMAVASASPRYVVLYVLEKFDILKYIEFFLSADDVINRTPDPEVWLKSAEELGLKPEECIAIEDAEKGVKAAFNGNMPVIAIPNEETMDNDFKNATYMAKDTKEAVEIVENLIK